MTSEQELDHHSEPVRRMVALGESTTAGGSATARSLCWASALADLICQFQHEPVELINAGIGANVISPRSAGHAHSGKPSALERYRRHVIDHQPDLVVISYGLNDMRCGTPVDQFAEDMALLLDAIRRETGAVIVLVGVYFMTAHDQHGPHWNKGSLEATAVYNAALRRLAEERHVLFADVFAAEGMAPWVVDTDGVHANNLGHRLIAHRLFEVLATRCSGLARKALDDARDYPRWRDESVLRAGF